MCIKVVYKSSKDNKRTKYIQAGECLYPRMNKQELIRKIKKITLMGFNLTILYTNIPNNELGDHHEIADNLGIGIEITGLEDSNLGAWVERMMNPNREWRGVVYTKKEDLEAEEEEVPINKHRRNISDIQRRR